MDYTSFTEKHYATLLDVAAAKYTFTHYDDKCDGPKVVWRHDVDYSPQRALVMARLEAERGLQCIYHVYPSGRYYNVLMPEISEIFREISTLGHVIGLHVDMDVFADPTNLSQDKFRERVQKEKELLEYLTGAPARSVSFHNCLLHAKRLSSEETLAGMVNVCCRDIWDGYHYISDSNGYWKEDSLDSILAREPHDRLHVLTHPIWWTSAPMSPAERFHHMIDGRAQADRDAYFDVMKRDGRFSTVVKETGFLETTDHKES